MRASYLGVLAALLTPHGTRVKERGPAVGKSRPRLSPAAPDLLADRGGVDEVLGPPRGELMVRATSRSITTRGREASAPAGIARALKTTDLPRRSRDPPRARSGTPSRSLPRLRGQRSAAPRPSSGPATTASRASRGRRGWP